MMKLRTPRWSVPSLMENCDIYIFTLNIYIYIVYIRDIDAYIQRYRCVNNIHVYILFLWKESPSNV